MAEETKNPETMEETQAQEAASAKQESKKTAKTKEKETKSNAAAVAAAETRAEEAEQKLGELQNTLMRTAAEYDNFRKRSQKERDAAFNDGLTHAVLELLPVVDTLEAAADAVSEDEEYKKGVLLTLEQFIDILGKLGIQEIDCLGQPFDPELHNAVMQEECADVESGCISRVIRKGYMLGDRIVRYSMVCVAP